jgi:hypothetical protein
MRVTVHLDSFDRFDPCAYAIVWIDTASGKWSREGHSGVALPAWGRCARVPEGTSLVAAEDSRGICTVEGLDLAASDGPFEGEDGRAQWHARERAEPLSGRWRVQCVDACERDPEESLFADEA